MDAITFQFTGNKGTALQPLQDVASGGELSRLSLALKSIYSIQAALPTIIFDEIDTGISGEVAWMVKGELITAHRFEEIKALTKEALEIAKN